VTPDVVTIGGVTLDWIISGTGEVAIRCCGGNALYSAVGARLWGVNVAVVSNVGDDYPEEMLEAFSAADVDLSGIRRLDEPHELVFAAQYDRSGERFAIRPSEVFPPNGIDAPEARELHPLFREPWDSDLASHFDPMPDQVPSDYWKAGGFHVGGMRRVAQFAFVNALSKLQILSTLDPGLVEDQIEREQLLGKADVLLPSETDMRWLTNELDLDLALHYLTRLGPEAVALKLGKRGSLIYDIRADRKRHVPIYPVTAKDPTGAGDAYCGGFLAGYLETADAFEAALRATVSASFVIEEFDARYALRFTRQDAENRLSTLRDLVKDGEINGAYGGVGHEPDEG
jgi:ribokinase